MTDLILTIFWFLSIIIIAGRIVSYGHIFRNSNDPKPNFLGLFYIPRKKKYLTLKLNKMKKFIIWLDIATIIISFPFAYLMGRATGINNRDSVALGIVSSLLIAIVLVIADRKRLREKE